ncbi:chromatin assembly factor 1 subunit A-domain-containing protein [Poronia punctata]|nr:chromatin assembly factor 1 subunit A-domain-containing protein [Poronia punctata]
MPLFPVSPNVKEPEAASIKRSTHGLIDTKTCQPPVDTLQDENSDVARKSPAMSTSTVDCQPHSTEVPATTMGSSPLSSPASISDADCTTPPRESLSPAPSTCASLDKMVATEPTQLQATDATTTAEGKKRKLTAMDQSKQGTEKKQKQGETAAVKAKTFAEKEAAKAAKAAEKARVEKEKEAAKAAKAAEKARLEAEREAVKVAKAAEKAKADALKEAKRQKKLEEELAAKAKKEKQQNLMASFLKKAAAAPAKRTDQPPAAGIKTETANPSDVKQEAETTKSAYEVNFKPFFVKSGVTMAVSPFEMDDETKEAKSNILDEHIRGERGEFNAPFNPTELFNIVFPKQRGIIPPSVKKIMEDIHGDPFQVSFGIGSKGDSQSEKRTINAQDQLNNIPMKYLRFHEDVRPAYFGTATTHMTYHKLRVLSRRPTGKMLPLAYDYDSEAEWVEDDGEDLDDVEDEEEDVDGDEEMDDFVDDSEAAPTIVRPGFEGDSQPVSTGLCFENEGRLGPCTTVHNYRLEFLLDSLEHHSMIDPFSTDYWPAPAKKPKATTATSVAKGTISSMLAPPVPVPRDAAVPVTSAPATLEGKDAVPQDILEDFKRALISDECKDFSKATVIELLAKKFTSCTKAQVKVTLDTIAHRVTPLGQKKSVKEWALLDAFALKK